MHIWHYSPCMLCFVLVNPSYYVHPVCVPNSRCARVLSIYACVHTYLSPCMECVDWLSFIFICLRRGSWTNLTIRLLISRLLAKRPYLYVWEHRHTRGYNLGRHAARFHYVYRTDVSRCRGIGPPSDIVLGTLFFGCRSSSTSNSPLYCLIYVYLLQARLVNKPHDPNSYIPFACQTLELTRLTFIFICCRPGSWTNRTIQLHTFRSRAKIPYFYICMYACIRDIVVRVCVCVCVLNPSYHKTHTTKAEPRAHLFFRRGSWTNPTIQIRTFHLRAKLSLRPRAFDICVCTYTCESVYGVLWLVVFYIYLF